LATDADREAAANSQDGYPLPLPVSKRQRCSEL
jgi:hypothetical protein